MDFNNLTKFETALRQDKSVYVINNTEPRGLFVCTVSDPTSGRQVKLELQKTWIPYCLTDILPRGILETSVEIRNSLRKNILRIIDEKEALSMLNSPKGRAEYARLNASEFTAGTASERKSNLMESVSLTQAANSSTENPNVDAAQITLHPKMQAWEQRVAAGEMDGNSLASELEIHRGELTEEDLQFLLAGAFLREAKEFATEALQTGNYRTSGPMKQGALFSTGNEPSATSYEADWG
jgi:hypothetical protein